MRSSVKKNVAKQQKKTSRSPLSPKNKARDVIDRKKSLLKFKAKENSLIPERYMDLVKAKLKSESKLFDFLQYAPVEVINFTSKLPIKYKKTFFMSYRYSNCFKFKLKDNTVVLGVENALFEKMLDMKLLSIVFVKQYSGFFIIVKDKFYMMESIFAIKIEKTIAETKLLREQDYFLIVSYDHSREEMLFPQKNFVAISGVGHNDKTKRNVIRLPVQIKEKVDWE